MHDGRTYAVLHSLTLHNFSGTLQSVDFIVLKLYLVGVPLKSVPRTMWIKSINSTAVTFCAPLKMLQKALSFKGAAPGLHLDATRIYCKMLFTFAVLRRLISFSWVGCQIASTHADCLKHKHLKCLNRCKSRYRWWVTFQSRRGRRVKKYTGYRQQIRIRTRIQSLSLQQTNAEEKLHSEGGAIVCTAAQLVKYKNICILKREVRVFLNCRWLQIRQQ